MENTSAYGESFWFDLNTIKTACEILEWARETGIYLLKPPVGGK